MFVYTFLTLACSFLYAVSAVLCKYGLQHGVELRTFPVKRILRFLATNRIWLLGVALSVFANISIVEIQSHIDVSVVYPILNFSYVFTLILGYYFLNEVLGANQWTGIAVVTIGTVILLFIDQPATGQPTDVDSLLFLTLLAIVSIVALMFLAFDKSNLNYEIFYALCTGICFGLVETYLKANTNLIAEELGYFSIFSMDSIIAFLTVWPFFLMVLFTAVGWVCLQITYSHGNVSITIPLLAVFQRTISMSSGYFVFGEEFSTTKLIGLTTIIVGVIILVSSTIEEKEATTV